MLQRLAIHDSYWLKHTQSSIVSTPKPRFASLSGTHRSDVVIVGGGITGLSTALELLERGYSVAVYDALTVSAGTTSASTGHVDAHPEMGTSALIKKLGIEAARQYVELRKKAIDVIERRATPLCDFVRVPAFQYSEDHADEDEMRKEFESAVTIGLDAHWEGDLSSNIGHMKVGFRLDDMARVNVFAYQMALLERLTSKGGKVFEQTLVSAELDARGNSVKAGEGKAEFDHLVYAVHSNFTDAMRIDMQIPAYQSYALAAHFADPLPDQLMWDNSDPYYYTRRLESSDPHKVVVGGCDHRTGMGSADEAMRTLEAYVRERYVVESILGRWSAEFFEPADGMPLIGQVPQKKNIWIATGLSGVGLTHGTMAGRMIAQQISGAVAPLEEHFSPARFSLRDLGSVIAEQFKSLSDYAERIMPARKVNIADLKIGGGMVGEVDGEFVAVHRDDKGQIRKCNAICRHMGGVVHWNAFEKTWDCPIHGGRYASCGQRIYGPPEEPLDRA
jgi:glycine/D-amino acid oxidase-like deaminating enzyme/nitrite reductase/ring-hydroxylating ferredoxin subunit